MFIYIVLKLECGQSNFGLFYLLHFELDLNSSSDSFVLLRLRVENVNDQISLMSELRCFWSAIFSYLIATMNSIYTD